MADRGALAKKMAQPAYRDQELRSREPSLREQILYKLFGDDKTLWRWADERGIGSKPVLGQDVVPRGVYDTGRSDLLTQDIIDAMPVAALTTKPVQAVAKAMSKQPVGIRAYHGTPAQFDQFNTPAYFSTDRAYAQKFAGDSGRVVEAELGFKNPYWTSDQGFVESLRSVPERQKWLVDQGYDGVVFSAEKGSFDPVLQLGGYAPPQIVALDPSTIGKPPVGIRAYHGSPHDFDKFSMDKIGTGEGAQAYGHGLYFAESEGVAKSYRDALVDDHIMNRVVKFEGRSIPFGASTPEDLAARHVAAAEGNVEQALKRMQGMYNREELYPPNQLAAMKLLEKEPKRFADVKYEPLGHMYEVNIRANPEDFLDWDKPLSQQSEKVRGAINDVGYKPQQDAGLHPRVQEGTRPSATAGGYGDEHSIKGGDIIDVIARKEINGDWGAPGELARAMATRKLRDAGIPGIRYLDQGSRSAGEGSRNYVVFDDALIDIVRKYGWAGAAAMLGLGAMSEDQAQAAVPKAALTKKMSGQ